MALNERDFFNEKQETRATPLTCPRCRRKHDYQLRWVRRLKKDRIPPGADERDRALYAKLRDYMIRVDDVVHCQTVGRDSKCRLTSRSSFCRTASGNRISEDQTWTRHRDAIF